MFKTFMTAVAFVGLIASTQVAHADTQWNNPNNNGYWQTARADTAHRENYTDRHQKTLKKNVHKKVRNTAVPLKRLFDLSRDYAGYRVDAVIVKLNPGGAKGRMKLMVNGRAVDGQSIRGRRVIRLDVNKRTVIGSNMKSLRLDVKGKAFIKDIKVKLSPTVTSRRDNRRNAESNQRISQRTIERITRLILRQMNQNSYAH